MSQFKEAQVVMLPTTKDNISVNEIILNIFDKCELDIVTKHNIFTKETFRFGKYGITFRNSYSHNGFENQHLYIVSNDEIKKGDWCYDKYNYKPVKYSHNIAGLYFVKTFKNTKEHEGYSVEKESLNKIIATTDTSLKFKHWVAYGKVNGKEFGKEIDCSLSKPSEQFIEKYIEEYNKGNIIKDVLVEYEQDLSNIGNLQYWNYKLKLNPKDNTITIKKLKESWNREEVEQLLSKFSKDFEQSSRISGYIKEKTTNWIKENL